MAARGKKRKRGSVQKSGGKISARPTPTPSRKRLTESQRVEIAKQARREIDKRVKQFEKVKARVKPRKTDPPLVFVLANDQRKTVGHKTRITAKAGQRVTRGDRRKVFVFRKTRPSKKHPKGRLIPYRDWKEKGRLKKLRVTVRSVPPKPVTITSADVSSFKSKKVIKYFYAGRKRAHPAVTIQRRKKPNAKKAPVLDFMDHVVPKVADALQNAADRYQDRREFELECAAVVRLPGGKVMTPRFEVNFKQADMQQFMDQGFYEPFVSRKLYAEFAEQLKGMGLVTTGSAQYIEALPINAGRTREQWRDNKGFLWKHGQGWKLKECELVRFDAVPNYIIVRSGE